LTKIRLLPSSLIRLFRQFSPLAACSGLLPLVVRDLLQDLMFKAGPLFLTRRRNDATLQGQGPIFRIFVASSRRRVKPAFDYQSFGFPRENVFQATA
jgi:hypothetical protein